MPESTQTVSDATVVEPPLRLLPAGSVVAGRYEVRGRLGTGGCAVVYSAYDRELQREIALKVLRSDRVSVTALKRMRREVAVAREAPGRCLVRVYDIGRSGAATYLTMELVRGESLRERLRRGTLEIEEAVGICRDVAEALAELHRLKVVHRDVKPGNILLDQEGRVKLADFGLALELEGSETRATATDGVVGTVEYLSPEQALNREPAPASDLYSLGVVFFEMLTGEVPHKGDSALGTLLGRLDAALPQVRQLRPDVPRWLSRVMNRLLARELPQRYGSAEEVLRDLEQKKARGFWSRRILRAAPAAVLGTAMLGAALWLWAENRPRFSHLGPLEGGGVVALGTRGETLWTLPEGWGGNGESLATAVLAPDGPLRVVGVFYGTEDLSPEKTRVLSILDAESGEVLRRVGLPSAAEEFPGYADRYGCEVTAADLDGDGGDEIVLSYVHRPYWPSYTVVWEPRLERSRIAFMGSGHHRFVGAEDLDGDGSRELLLVGINNRMGWHSATAAVRLVPAVGAVKPPGFRVFSARSPDAWSPDEPVNSLLWYALGPQGGCVDLDDCVDIDRGARQIELSLTGGVRRLDFLGFAVGASESTSSPRERAKLRRRAYERLGEAQRLLELELASEAMTEVDRALAAATQAGDRLLVEWVSMVRARILLARGDLEEAERSFSALMSSSEAVSEIAFEAARSFHLRGSLDRALAWYRRGLGPGGSSRIGRRARLDFLDGIVLCLAEKEAWSEAMAEITAFTRAFSNERGARFHREFVVWRSGGRPDPAPIEVNAGSPDLIRYWALELRAAVGHQPAELVSQLDYEMQKASGTEGLLWSLHSELLAALGRREEAFDRGRQAYQRLLQDRATDTAARAHFELVAERFVRLSERLGRVKEAGEASLELERWRKSKRSADQVPSAGLAESADRGTRLPPASG